MIFNRQELQAIISSVESNFVAACAIHFERLRERVATGEAEVRYGDTATFSVFRRVTAEILERMEEGAIEAEEQPLVGGTGISACAKQPESGDDQPALCADAQARMHVPPQASYDAESNKARKERQHEAKSVRAGAATREIMNRGKAMLEQANRDPVAAVALDVVTPRVA